MELYVIDNKTLDIMSVCNVCDYNLNLDEETNGISEFLQMMALISISLGITNLLPIPALDGGKILILIIETIRRKPMKQETEIGIQMLGFAILIGLSLIITYNDILRIF